MNIECHGSGCDRTVWSAMCEDKPVLVVVHSCGDVLDNQPWGGVQGALGKCVGRVSNYHWKNVWGPGVQLLLQLLQFSRILRGKY